MMQVVSSHRSENSRVKLLFALGVVEGASSE